MTARRARRATTPAPPPPAVTHHPMDSDRDMWEHVCPDITPAEITALLAAGIVPGIGGPPVVDRRLLLAFRAGAGHGAGGKVPTGDVLSALTGGPVTPAAHTSVTIHHTTTEPSEQDPTERHTS